MSGHWLTKTVLPVMVSILLLVTIGLSQESFAQTTGSVSLDRGEYPVPFGQPRSFAFSSSTTPDGRSLFPMHQTAMDSNPGLQSGETIDTGILKVYILIDDDDFNESDVDIDSISSNTPFFLDICTGLGTPFPICLDVDTAAVGVLKIIIERGGEEVVLGYAGGTLTEPGLIDVNGDNPELARHFGPLDEIAADAGVFRLRLLVTYVDGPDSSTCPSTDSFTS